MVTVIFISEKHHTFTLVFFHLEMCVQFKNSNSVFWNISKNWVCRWIKRERKDNSGSDIWGFVVDTHRKGVN